MKDKSVIYAFIDASNLWEAQKAMGQFFDYEKLRNFLKKKFKASNNESSPPRGGLPLDVIPFQFMAKLKDISIIADS